MTSDPENEVHMHSHPEQAPPRPAAQVLDAAWLRQLCLDAGADDVGFIELERPALDDERPHLLNAFPHTHTVLSFVVRMNRENVRSPARSIANNEFHHAGKEVDDVAREITAALERLGIRALNPPMAFPMEADRWMTERLWVVSHKPIAVAAGLGRIGIHRNVIHPRFGNFILLGTILLGAEVSQYNREIDYNPCFECKLCVAACPVGAIGADGHFNFTSCYTHNYREFMGGFNDWVETVADSRHGKDYRQRVRESESISVWQSLAFGPNYKAAYCMAVCPAGEDVISLYRASKKNFTAEVMKPLQAKVEPLYVIPGSDAEAHAKQRYPHKELRYVRKSLHPRNLKTLLEGMPRTFQRHAAGQLEATYHFTFTGSESATVTIVIGDGKFTLIDGLQGKPNIHVTADTATWLGFLAKEKSLPWALLTGRIKLRGNPKWLRALDKCFPG